MVYKAPKSAFSFLQEGLVCIWIFGRIEMKKPYGLLTVVLLAAIVSAALLPAEGAPNRVGRGPLMRITFIHYKRGHAKPPWAVGPDKTKDDDGDYTYLSKGAKWRTLEDFVVNPSNSQGLPADFVVENVAAGMDEWETYGGAIFGQLYVDYSASFNNGDLDGVNSVSFGQYDEAGVIAVTNVWGYFTGPPKSREIIEADILFDEDFTWGDGELNPALMDLLNIAVHEIGHAAGMGDLYDSDANLESMYGYSTEGEIIKRDLYTGDITGITKLYQ